MNDTPITLTPDQQHALDKLVAFIDSDDKVFILCGYAGTGKTTLVKAFITELSNRKLKCNLLASTGRAAKILSNITGGLATTVHGKIYTFKDFNQDLEETVTKQQATGVDSTGQLYLTFELHRLPDDETRTQHFYIIDESSMVSDIADKNITQALFGSGRLLKDLLDFDSRGKFIFVGDHGQLPPVVTSSRSAFSPALSVEYFSQTFKLNAQMVELTQIMRQHKGNDIIESSKRVRALAENVPQEKWGKLPLRGYKNIKLYTDSISLVKQYINLIQDNSYNNATLISYYNKRTTELTELIRPALGKQKMLQEGDLLLITQNNIPTGLMNGDMVLVTQVDSVVMKRARLTFRKVELMELFTHKTYSYFMVEEPLYSNETNLNQVQQQGLFIDFYKRMKEQGIKQNTLQFKDMMLTDPYLNALRAVFGYAITCHKAQGGEWDHVFLDIPRNLTLNATKSAYQWVYTAMTRARHQLHVIDDFYIK